MKVPFIIGITGGSGSGKTTIINHLRNTYSVEHLCLISQDDYYKAREEQITDENGIRNFDLPTSIKREAFYNDILRLLQGKEVRFQEYTFNNDLVEPKEIVLKSAPVIVVEGLFVFHFPEIVKLMDLKVFIDASDVVKVKRRILRDQLERNYPLEDVLYRYEKHVIPAYEQHILPYKKQADIIINNEFTYKNGLQVLCAFIEKTIGNFAVE